MFHGGKAGLQPTEKESKKEKGDEYENRKRREEVQNRGEG